MTNTIDDIDSEIETNCNLDFMFGQMMTVRNESEYNMLSIIMSFNKIVTETKTKEVIFPFNPGIY